MTKQTKKCKACGQFNPASNHKKVCPARFEKIVPRDQDVSLIELARSQRALKDAQASRVTEVWAENLNTQSAKFKNIIAKPIAPTSPAERVRAFESAMINPEERPAIEAIYGPVEWAA